ncbi:Nonribosomal peptide synthase sidC [Bienertia sinuspersici]
MHNHFGPQIKVPQYHPSSSMNTNHGVVGLFKDFREFKLEELGPVVVQKISQRIFLFHCILDDDKRSLLHHASACFHACLVVFKEWRDELTIKDYKFAETAMWVRVEGIPANVNQTTVALSILERVGACIFVDHKNFRETPQRSIRIRVWLDLRKPLISGMYLYATTGTPSG